jgi:hypothetical protein
MMTLNFIKNIYFGLPSFSVYRWPILLVFRNSILISKFISFIFNLFFIRGERERGLLDSNVNRENHRLHLF